jgi:alkylation response protein AidB-like acyl-CoA dehydrogenase
VLGAPDVDEVVVAARRETGTLGLFVVPAAELTFKRTTSLDPTRSLANVELNGVWVPEARMLGEPDVDAGKALELASCDATVALALDGLGACAALFDSCLAAAHDGRIAHAGQSTEHALAGMLVSIEMSRALTYQAACAVAERDATAPRMASSAKAAIGECQRLVTGTCLELHGTPIDRDARDLRLWVGRAKADDLLFGSSADHRRIIADQMLSNRRARASQLATALLH